MSLKKGSYKVEKGSLGLAEKGKVNKKGGVASKNTNKEVYRLKAKELLIYFCNIT
jgi:hypothetical protein